MHEHAIERSIQPQGAHVTLYVLALWVEETAEREHCGGEVDEGASEGAFEMSGVVATAAAKIQQRARLVFAVLFEQAKVVGGLLDVVGDGSEQGIPCG